MDILIAALLAVPALPLLIVAAILIKLDSKGPALFVQPRMGRGFRRFQLVKLRTMRLSGGSTYTLGADPRITRVGRWLRRLKFDELPQLWNVLCGEMSIVGPRPVIPELTMEFRREYECLLLVRPGLTDPATIKYCRETEILALAPEPLRFFKAVVVPDKLRISQDYLDCSTLWSDLGVMARTVLALAPAAWSIRAALPTVARPSRKAASKVVEFEPRMQVHPVLDSALITVPPERMTLGEGSNSRAGQMTPNLLA
jgi:lipopolysaccharide/colanic/teichoic acid biosynthesis glycosyltransferase